MRSYQVQTTVPSSGKSVISTTSSHRSIGSNRSISSQQMRSRLQMLGVGAGNDAFFVSSYGITQPKMIAETRSSSYHKMLQRNVPQRQVDQVKRQHGSSSRTPSAGRTSNVSQPRIVSSSSICGGKSMCSNASVATVSTSGFSCNTGIRAVRDSRIKKQRSNTKKVVEHIEQSDSYLAGRKNAKKLRNKERLMKKRSAGQKVRKYADSTTREGKDIAMCAKGLEDSKKRGLQILHRLRRRRQRQRSKKKDDELSLDSTKKSSHRVKEIPILATIDVSSNDPLRLYNLSSNGEKENGAKQNAVAQKKNFSESLSSPGNSQFSPKIDLPGPKKSKFLPAHNRFFSRRKQRPDHPTKLNVASNMASLPSPSTYSSSHERNVETLEATEMFPHSKITRVVSMKVSPIILTTLSRTNSIVSLHVPCVKKAPTYKFQEFETKGTGKDSTTPDASPVSIVDGLFRKIWDVVDRNYRLNRVSPQQPHTEGRDDDCSFLNEEGEFSDISSSEDDSSDGSEGATSDVLGLFDSVFSLPRVEEEEEEEDDDEQEEESDDDGDDDDDDNNNNNDEDDEHRTNNVQDLNQWTDRRRRIAIDEERDGPAECEGFSKFYKLAEF